MKVSFTQNDKIDSRRVISTPSPFARGNLLYLQEIGELKALEPYEDHRSHLSSFLVFTVVSGSGKLQYRDAVYELIEDDCVFIDCNEAYEHITYDDLWNLKWIHFNGSNMKAIYSYFEDRGGTPVFRMKSSSSFDAIWQDLMHISSFSDTSSEIAVNGKLNTLISILFDECLSSDSTDMTVEKMDRIEDVRKYLDEHFAEKITLDDLAEQFYINKHYLGRIFHQKYGMTLNGYIMYLRVARAKYLLRFTDETMEEIAAECGISDSNYFSRMFKHIEGVTPSEFRRSW